MFTYWLERPCNCPVAIHVKLRDNPTIITAVVGGITILGVSEGQK